MKMLKRELLRFGKFVYERQAVWHRRFIEKLPPSEWTRDPVLRRYKFTNVYRELDRGTIYFYCNMLYKYTRNDFKEVLWQSFVYRLVNRVSTFQRIVIPHHDNWTKLVQNNLKREISEVPDPFFTSAHQNFPPRYVGQDLRMRVVEMMDSFHPTLDRLRDDAGILTGNKFHKLLTTCDGLGAFRSTEVMKDLMMMCLLPYGPDDWTYPGPGALAGLSLLVRDGTRPSKTEAKELIQELTEDQLTKWLPEKWDDVRLKEYPLLSLCNVEHALCEYFKYRRARDGGSAPRVGYDAVKIATVRDQEMRMDPLVNADYTPYVIPNHNHYRRSKS